MNDGKTARRVAITSLGAITSIGTNTTETWKNVVNGMSGVVVDNRLTEPGLPKRVYGMIPRAEEDLGCADGIPNKGLRKLDPFIVYGLTATSQAITESGFDALSEAEKSETAVFVGSGIGGIERLYETSVTLSTEGSRRVSPYFIPSVLINMASSQIAMKYGFKGANFSVVSACATGIHNIGEAYRYIRDGYADYAVAGGTEAALSPLGIAGFSAMHALSTHYTDTPELASRPWDKGRDGFVMGEGAGIVTLETLESAKRRGAKIYAEIVGYGASCDAYHITSPAPDASGAILSMKRALKDAKISPEDIDYINAHGTSTIVGDRVEIMAIKETFGAHAYKLNISSTKSAMGHLLGAAGAVETIICVKAMQDSIVPPTLNLYEPDEGFDLNLTPLKPQERDIKYAMNNSFGFGGTNGTLILKRYDGD